MNSRHRKGLKWGSLFSLLVVTGTGCHKAPEAAPPASASDPQLTNSRINSIQNDPKMSPADKERVIATLKSRQGSAGGTASH